MGRGPGGPRVGAGGGLAGGGATGRVSRWEGAGAGVEPGRLGTLGVGMPVARAAELAHPDRQVVIVYGDGSFGLNGFEFDTAVRFGLPIIGVVGNDSAWGQMMRPQGAMLGWDRLDGTLLNPTRYDKVVEALGGHGEFVERPEELGPALERAAASGAPDVEHLGEGVRLVAADVEDDGQVAAPRQVQLLGEDSALRLAR